MLAELGAAVNRNPDDDWLAELRRKYLVAQLAGDRRKAVQLIVDEGLNQGASVQELQLHVIQEAQREIGRLWQLNQISIAQEHMATAISHLALSHLFQHAAQAPSWGRKVLVACVEGELHDFPARLVADALELDGFEVKYLGANVPTDSLLKMIEQERPDLLALSVTMTFNVGALIDAVARVRTATAGKLPIAVGGHACHWSEQTTEQLQPDATGKDALEMVRAARRLLVGGRP